MIFKGSYNGVTVADAKLLDWKNLLGPFWSPGRAAVSALWVLQNKTEPWDFAEEKQREH
jgi:hypothetical protein